MRYMNRIIPTVIFVCLLCSMSVFADINSQSQPGRARTKEIRLNLKDISQLALRNSLDIQIAKFNAYSKRTALAQMTSVFDTVLKGRALYTDDQKKTTSTIFGTKSTEQEYGIGLAKKLPSGTTIDLDFADERSFSNSAFTSLSPAHQATVRFSIHQPLGNNFFGLLDRGQVKITQIDVANSDFDALDRIEAELARVQNAYWQLALRYQEQNIALDMLERAQRLYAIFKDKHAIGLVEDAELFAAEANVARRKTSLLVAKHQILVANNELLLSVGEEDLSICIIPEDLFADERTSALLEESLQQAIMQRRDYKRAKNEIKAKNINLRMKNNSLWPQIDLEASLLQNGLEQSQSKAWENVIDEDNPELFVGLRVHVLLENTAARGQQRRAKWEKAKSLLSLKKTEHMIAVDVNNAVNAVNNSLEKLFLNEHIVALEEKKLAFQETRFASGRSDTDTLIRYQEDLLQAQHVLTQTVFEYKRALIDLQRAEHSLLNKYWQGKL